MENKLVNEEMVTLVCHVNGLKMSHKDPFEVIKFVTYVSYIYGNKLKVYRVKLNDYIDMVLGC